MGVLYKVKDGDRKMIVMEIALNGKVLAKAGREDMGVLSAVVSASGMLGNESVGKLVGKDDSEYGIDLHVGGLSAPMGGKEGEHAKWVENNEIKLGEEITIRLVEADEADAELKSNPTTYDVSEEEQRERWEAARDYFFYYKDLFDPEEEEKEEGQN